MDGNTGLVTSGSLIPRWSAAERSRHHAPRSSSNSPALQRRSILGWLEVISLWLGRSTEADGWVLINNTHCNLYRTIVIDPTTVSNCV